MKRSPYVLSLILIFTLVCNAQKNQLYAPGEVLMKLKNPEIHALSYVGERISSGVELLDRYLATQGLKAFNNIFQPTSDLRGYYKLAFPKEVDVAEICKNLKLIAAIEYATLNYYAELSSDPDDPLWSAQWQGTKQQFREAWDITRGSPAVLVGVMDSGL